MKDNKHPHHDLIVEWAKDTKKKTQRKNSCKEWVDCSGALIADDEDGQFEFRFKPREFTKGHWYPCIPNGKHGSVVIMNFKDGRFYTTSCHTGDDYNVNCFSEVGESLGEIKFGG